MMTIEQLPDTFDGAAHRYDLMVALNPGYHRHLRSAADALVEKLRHCAPRVVDLGCGSGASTRALLRSLQPTGDQAQILGIDASTGMLSQALAKRWPRGVRFLQGFAQQLGSSRSAWGLTEPVDGVLAAYLFRNVVDSERTEVLADVFDLLADHGTLVVQEYSVQGRPAADLIWTAVCWLVVVPLGLVTSGRTALYRYLWRSVRSFDSVAEFTDRLHAVGFRDVEVKTVSGWQRGILHTFRARKPAAG